MRARGPIRDERGQTTLEWMGIAAIVVALLGAVLASDLGSTVSARVGDLLCRTTGGGCEAGDGTGGEGTADAEVGEGPVAGTQDRGTDGATGGGEEGLPSGMGDGALDSAERDALAAAIATGDPAAIRAALEGLSEAEVAQAVEAFTDDLALTHGVPQPVRVAANRIRIQQEIDRLQAELDVPPDDSIRGSILEQIRESTRLGGMTEAERAARIQQRIDTLEGWLKGNRQIIEFRPPEDPVEGDGTVIEVFGDLETADRVGVIVPGITNNLDNYDEGFRESVLDIAEGAGEGTALVANLGYDTPNSLTDPATSTGGRAQDAGPGIAALIDTLDADGRDRDITLVGHSYGSRVAAEAARRAADIDRLVLIGSPGTGADTAAELGLDPADVYIGRNTADEIRFAPPISIGNVGHGTDPTDEDYGGNLLAPGPGGHSDYFEPGNIVGDSIRAIVDGRPEDADVAVPAEDRGGG